MADIKVEDDDEAFEVATRLKRVLEDKSPNLKLVRRYANLIAKWASRELKR